MVFGTTVTTTPTAIVEIYRPTILSDVYTKTVYAATSTVTVAAAPTQPVYSNSTFNLFMNNNVTLAIGARTSSLPDSKPTTSNPAKYNYLMLTPS